MCAPEITLWDKVPSPGALFFLFFFSPLPLPRPHVSLLTQVPLCCSDRLVSRTGVTCATIPICNSSSHPPCVCYMTQAGLKFAFSCFGLLGTEITYGRVVMGHFALLLVPNHTRDIHLGGTQPNQTLGGCQGYYQKSGTMVTEHYA